MRTLEDVGYAVHRNDVRNAARLSLTKDATAKRAAFFLLDFRECLDFDAVLSFGFICVFLILGFVTYTTKKSSNSSCVRVARWRGW